MDRWAATTRSASRGPVASTTGSTASWTTDPRSNSRRGFDRPQIAVINGLVKPNATLFSDAEYKRHVRKLGDDYLAKLPRPIAEGDDD
jgi:hypothetical protein